MTRLLYDLLRPNAAALARQLEFSPQFTTDFLSAQIFEITNVSDYFYSLPTEIFNLHTDYPNVAPPFPSVWFEHTSPKLVNREGEILTVARDLRDFHYGTLVGSVHTDTGWECYLAFFLSHKEPDAPAKSAQVITTHYVFKYRVDPSGRVIPTSTEILFPPSIESPNAEIQTFIHTLTCITFLALSFCNCKNVTLETTDPHALRAPSHRNKNGPQSLYKTLNINPAKTILSHKGGAEVSGLKHALHICRGHFKTFTSDAPLLGKVTGTYWWESHIRGTPDLGLITKSYKVNSPLKPALPPIENKS